MRRSRPLTRGEIDAAIKATSGEKEELRLLEISQRLEDINETLKLIRDELIVMKGRM